MNKTLLSVFLIEQPLRTLFELLINSLNKKIKKEKKRNYLFINTAKK